MSAEEDDDPGDLAGLCAQLRPQLVRALTLHTGDRAVAEELAQETLVRLWQRWPRVRRLDSPQEWAHRVAANLARSWWRRRAAERRAHQRLDADRGRPAPTGLDDVVTLREAVAGLPRRQREALVWRHYRSCPLRRPPRRWGVRRRRFGRCAARASAGCVSEGWWSRKCRRRLLMDEPIDRALARAADGPADGIDLDEVAATARRRRRRQRVVASAGVLLVLLAPSPRLADVSAHRRTGSPG